MPVGGISSSTACGYMLHSRASLTLKHSQFRDNARNLNTGNFTGELKVPQLTSVCRTMDGVLHGSILYRVLLHP